MKPLIELNHVYKIYGKGDAKVNAIADVSLKIHRGEFVCIMGPSGSGKSTLMHIIGCLDSPTRGTVYINGKNASKLSERDLAKIRANEIGFVFQAFNLFPRLNALENVMIPMNFSNIKNKRERAMHLLEIMGLRGREYHKPSELSGGQKQRVAIARALANNPPIILADEPTGSLDTKSGNDVMKILKKLNEEGKTIILVTHDKSLSRYAERIIHIKDGKIIGGA